jgi:transcriptional regulator GlxA family with amidase domain
MYDRKQDFQLHSNFLLLSASLSILALNIFILLFPQILYGLPRINIPNYENTTQIVAATLQQQGHKSRKTNNEISSIPINGINEKLAELYKKSQPWTDKNFSTSTLSIAIGVPEHHLRYFLNHELKQSFSEYRNKIRVEHAKLLLKEGKLEQISIEGIGAMAGFASKSTFFQFSKKKLVIPLRIT